MMGDYTEHLISMAGGDGDDALDLDAIQARYPDREVYEVELIAMGLTARMDVPTLLALVREQQARIDAVSKILDEKYKLWAAICGNTCSKDIIGVDHDAITDEVAAAIRAALTATDKP